MITKKNILPNLCEWKKIQENCTISNISRLYKYKGNFNWKGIKTEKYKNSGNDWACMIRKTLIGAHGESTRFHVRYFEIAPGGYSSFEMHRHEHVVICVRGKGICLAGKKNLKLDFSIYFISVLKNHINYEILIKNPLAFFVL